MKKNDKLIAVFGVIIIVISSVGISMWAPPQTNEEMDGLEEAYSATSTFSNIPRAIAVSSDDPFYALIATPLAIHYTAEGDQVVCPLYTMDFDDPSDAVVDAVESINYVIDQKIGDDGDDAKNWSIKIAETYWERSDVAVIIEYNQSGYELGIVATPLASYLGAPIIVTDVIDAEITALLGELGVTQTIICGNLDGYGDTLFYNNVEQIVSDTIGIINEKFGGVEYITLANPLDAFPPEVCESKTFYMGPTEVTSGATSYLSQIGSLSAVVQDDTWTFTIPNGYKYARVRFEGINENSESVEETGDSVTFYIGPNLDSIPDDLQKYELFCGTTSGGGIPERDDQGNILVDKLEVDAVVYDRGGVEYSIRCAGSWLTQSTGSVSATVVVEKLSGPLYEPMHNVSAMAPYLTAYRKGVLFAKSDFAFAADDDVLDEHGSTCPGLYMPRRNPKLVAPSNKHIYDNIHVPLNELLAEIAGIDLDCDNDLESLKDHYSSQPLYIALCGGATVLPQYIYENLLESIDYETAPYYFGAGTPSDVIYGNIDPPQYCWDSITNDIYGEYPFQENIIGRVTGWDSQDVSALIARTFYYDEIIDNLGSWKDNFALLIGGGQDFQKPILTYPIFGGKGEHAEPFKMYTGYGDMCGERTQVELAEPMGFNVLAAYSEAAQSEGFSDAALTAIKNNGNILTKILFNKKQIADLVGEDVTYGAEYMESSNFIWANAHGQQHMFGMAGPELTASGYGFTNLLRGFFERLFPWFPLTQNGFLGPGASFSSKGEYGTRTVENMDFGPSFMWLESCICGKIDAVDPRTSSGQTLLHAGVTALVASSTGSNIGGGYLEPKNRMYDTKFSVWKAERSTSKDASNGEYPDAHFGYLLYTDMCNELNDDDSSIGLAFRNSRNAYLPKDADWELWWSPPLITTGNALLDAEIYDWHMDAWQNTSSGEKGPMLDNKYVSYYEYLLFADPAFNPYEPLNEGQ